MALPEGFAPVSEAKALVPAFVVPDMIGFDEYPGLINRFERHLIDCRRQLDQLESVRNNRYNLLKATEWRKSGQNDKERDAAFALILDADELYVSLDDDLKAFKWGIQDLESDLKRVENDWVRVRLRRREQVVKAELFGGIPVTD